MSYTPDAAVNPQPPYNTVFLSQRDLSLEVPINFVTVPGVSLSSACFGHKKYEDVAFEKCLSNLIASGFRKIEIDLYWDDESWSLCPARIPDSIPHASTTPTSANTNTQSTSVQLSSATPGESSKANIAVRQDDSSSLPAGSRAKVSDSSNRASTSISTVLVVSNNTSEPLIEIGPFLCTTSITLEFLLNVLLDYIKETETTVDASLFYLTFHIHSAASATAPTLPAPTPSKLPGTASLIGEIVSANLSAYIYTSNNLQSERGNLNNSWYKVSDLFRPVEDYYTTTKDVNGIVSTEDGWPSESYIELTRYKRLLLQWGNVDPQMGSYNFSGDDSIIFPQGYLQNIPQKIAANAAGNITHGCLLKDSTSDVSSVNSSFATVTSVPGFQDAISVTSNLTTTLNLTTNLVTCGFSPMLNATLLNVTADENSQPYQNFSYASFWAWAPGEPHDTTEDHQYKCASTNTKTGLWTTGIDCSNKLFAACRAVGNPYNFSITSYQVSYSFADEACKPLLFAVPRTALENSYLTQEIIRSHRDLDGNGVWVNWNSPTKGCWVSGNTSCPYGVGAEILRERSILIPTVAAIIVLVVTGLTMFVKIAGNRKVRKRTNRRANNGFVYEGVPS